MRKLRARTSSKWMGKEKKINMEESEKKMNVELFFNTSSVVDS